MLGGTHIEMTILGTMRDWVAGSRLATVMMKANIVTKGRANNCLKGKDTSRLQCSHQVSPPVSKMP